MLDNSNLPIPVVTMRLYQINNGGTGVPQEVVPAVQTNAAGYFSIQPAPVGLYKLMADGTTAASVQNRRLTRVLPGWEPKIFEIYLLYPSRLSVRPKLNASLTFMDDVISKG